MPGPTASPPLPGGAPLRVLRISHSAVVTGWRQRDRELRRAGVAVTLLSAARWEEGGSVVPFVADGDDFARPVATFGRHPNRFLYDPRPIWRALGQGPWDVLDVQEEPFGLPLAEVLVLRWLRRRRAPYVVYSAQNIEKRYPLPFRWLERRALRGAAGAYPCNEAAARILVARGLAGRVVVLPLGVDVERFTPTDRPPPGETLRVGFVGRLVPHKGVDVLLQAAAGDRRLSVEVVGAGPAADGLAALAARLGLGGRVTFTGHVDDDRAPEVYRGFDVLAVPSVPRPGWTEQFGRVVVEAQASGVPVVASRSGALPEVVGDAGVLVAPGDAGGLRTALVALLEDPDRWSELRAAGVEAALRCSWPQVAAAQLALYRSVAERSGADRA